MLSPYKKYLHKRWNEGCHNGTKLYQEIIERGYQGRYGTVAGYIRRLCKTQKLQQDQVKVFEPKKSLLTLRRTVKLILRKPSQQSESDKNIISLLKQQHPQLNTAIELIQRFADLVRNHQSDQLQEWYELASSCHELLKKRFLCPVS